MIHVTRVEVISRDISSRIDTPREGALVCSGACARAVERGYGAPGGADEFCTASESPAYCRFLYHWKTRLDRNLSKIGLVCLAFAMGVTNVMARLYERP